MYSLRSACLYSQSLHVFSTDFSCHTCGFYWAGRMRDCDVPLFFKGVEGLVTTKVGPVVSSGLEWDWVDEGGNRWRELEQMRIKIISTKQVAGQFRILKSRSLKSYYELKEIYQVKGVAYTIYLLNINRTLTTIHFIFNLSATWFLN